MTRLIDCRICGEQVASTASRCPNCGGAPGIHASGRLGRVKVSGGFAALVVMAMLMGTCMVCVSASSSGGSSSSTTTSEPASEAAARTANAPVTTRHEPSPREKFRSDVLAGLSQLFKSMDVNASAIAVGTSLGIQAPAASAP
jgi:hypothetical protein